MKLHTNACSYQISKFYIQIITCTLHTLSTNTMCRTTHILRTCRCCNPFDRYCTWKENTLNMYSKTGFYSDYLTRFSGMYTQGSLEFIQKFSFICRQFNMVQILNDGMCNTQKLFLVLYQGAYSVTASALSNNPGL